MSFVGWGDRTARHGQRCTFMDLKEAPLHVDEERERIAQQRKLIARLVKDRNYDMVIEACDALMTMLQIHDLRQALLKQAQTSRLLF